MFPTRYGDTHVLSLGAEDGPPVIFLHGGNFLNPTCLRWFLPIAQRHRIHAPDIVGQPGKSAQGRPSPNADSHAWWVEDVLDGLSLRRVPFVGLSYGAGIILRVAGYAPERVSGAVLVSPAAIASGLLGDMLLEALVPMVAYRLWPSHSRLLRAARVILTEGDDLAERQLGAIYRHVILDTQLPRMVTEEELRGFDEPVALFASEEDVFFPGEAVVARAREIVPNLVAAECLTAACVSSGPA
jgi:pimeloyl-ACP methyl ester carboxylesterase